MDRAEPGTMFSFSNAPGAWVGFPALCLQHLQPRPHDRVCLYLCLSLQVSVCVCVFYLSV